MTLAENICIVCDHDSSHHCCHYHADGSHCCHACMSASLLATNTTARCPAPDTQDSAYQAKLRAGLATNGVSFVAA